MTKPKIHDILGLSVEGIRNRNEARVVQVLRVELPQAVGFCGCRLCIEDAYAAALNQIPPQYAQTGSIVLKRQPSDAEIRAQVIDAIAKVGGRPKHPTESPPLPTARDF